MQLGPFLLNRNYHSSPEGIQTAIDKFRDEWLQKNVFAVLSPPKRLHFQSNLQHKAKAKWTDKGNEGLLALFTQVMLLTKAWRMKPFNLNNIE